MIRLIAWAPGHRGKFLIDAEGVLHHWRTDPNGAPHHGQVAEHLGIRSAIDGIVECDGAWWVSARDPTADHERLIARAAAQAVAAGLRPLGSLEQELRLWLDDDLVDRAAPEGWRHATTVSETIALLERGRVVELSLDHDLGDDEANGRGIDVVDFLAEEMEVNGRNLWPRDGITLHTANPVGREAMARAIRADAGRRFDVRETRTASGKPRFQFKAKDE